MWGGDVVVGSQRGTGYGVGSATMLNSEGSEGVPDGLILKSLGSSGRVHACCHW